jgi:hypothetical protein
MVPLNFRYRRICSKLTSHSKKFDRRTFINPLLASADAPISLKQLTFVCRRWIEYSEINHSLQLQTTMTRLQASATKSIMFDILN